jgi:hypothetical protein
VITVVPPKHRADVAIDRFDFPEGDILVAVFQDAGQMAHQQGAELLEKCHALIGVSIGFKSYSVIGRAPCPPHFAMAHDHSGAVIDYCISNAILNAKKKACPNR